MEKIKLVLKFKLDGDGDCHFRGASRITVDGHGGLMLHEAANGHAERIDLTKVKSLWIQPVIGSGQAA